jgi:hypothetical protein
MVRRGLDLLDELDEAERVESEAMVAMQLIGAVDTINWNAVFILSSDIVSGSLLGGIIYQ